VLYLIILFLKMLAQRKEKTANDKKEVRFTFV